MGQWDAWDGGIERELREREIDAETQVSISRKPLMSAKKAHKKKPITLIADDPEALKGSLKAIGGSQSDHWNNILANQTVKTLWLGHSDEESRTQQYSATVAALIGIGPKGEMEGMIAAQLVAAHNAAMECYRRAMIREQTFEGHRENLTQATSCLALTRYCLMRSTGTAERATKSHGRARPCPRRRPGHRG